MGGAEEQGRGTGGLRAGVSPSVCADGKPRPRGQRTHQVAPGPGSWETPGEAAVSSPRSPGTDGQLCKPQGWRVLVAETTSQQERLQAIAEKRRRQAEMENQRRQLEDARRQLQHLKSKALRERWLLEGAPCSASDGDEDLRRQMEADEQRARLLEEAIGRLEKEIEALENADAAPATAREPAAAPSPAQEEEKAEVVVNSQQSPVGTPKEKRVSTPARTAAGATMMKAGGSPRPPRVRGRGSPVPSAGAVVARLDRGGAPSLGWGLAAFCFGSSAHAARLPPRRRAPRMAALT
ncbi:paralemmin-1-like isoform X3 [Equus quagga]|uniref:paralemmin-1-like isoform X3 n=1 Tax=Equus quagga TaxID=89248 RepID=UPI001EE1CDDE|nr:paralemmin-1-like isoform X3 [Equus quagga]XP_046505207.1 paralemmin-1-like isoform X3 [Equus quagga]